ncbi:MAG: S41 family peptidase [Alphaproteobacteria bacterium]|nr:S41 family peptidase [Alphaproteobacteria bacterium]
MLGLFSSGLLGGAWLGARAAEHAQDPYGALDTLVRVIGLVETTWVDEIGTEELVEAALQGMVDRLDAHSAWMTPEAYRDLQRETHGAYTGLGVEVRLTDEGPRVTRVLPGSPASRDGITVGDLILEVDGQRLEASEMEEVNRALLGPRGQPARLQVRRAGDGSDHTIQTVRDRVEAPNVDVDALAPGIAYARMVQFREGAAADLERQLARHVAEGPVEALVLDLRDNPGGLLTEAVATADLFLSEGPIVSTTGRVEGERRAFEATPDSLGVPVVVLVNGRSASAAEIVAAALQDTRAGRLVGTRTYGKGSIQTVFEHRDGSALKLTVGRYLTPSGTPVAPRDGRLPDVVIPWPGEDTSVDDLREAIVGLPTLTDDQRTELLDLVDGLPHAELRMLRSSIPWDGPPASRLARDPQLTAALTEARRLADEAAAADADDG